MHVQHTAQIEHEAKEALLVNQMKEYQPPAVQGQQMQRDNRAYTTNPGAPEARDDRANTSSLSDKPPVFSEEEHMETVKTSQISKYHLNQQVSGLGGGHVSGFIHKIVANSPGSSSGPGTLYVSLMPMDDEDDANYTTGGSARTGGSQSVSSTGYGGEMDGNQMPMTTMHVVQPRDERAVTSEVAPVRDERANTGGNAITADADPALLKKLKALEAAHAAGILDATEYESKKRAAQAEFAASTTDEF
jgi:hypothetical protein